jgi:hypothetical protein
MAILRAASLHGKSVPPICNINAVITCPHQAGKVQLIPKQTTVMVGGAPALRATDMPGMPVLPGCPNLPTPGTPTFVPCTAVITPGVPPSTKVMIGGQPALLANATMTTNSVVPVPSGTTVKFPGQVLVQASG